MRKLAMLAAATIAATGFTATPVLAQTITTGQSQTITFGGPAGTTEGSTLQLTFQSFTGGIATYQYIFTNTQPALGNLVGFAFSTDPLLQGITDGTIAGYTDLDFFKDINSNYPGGFVIDACGNAGGNNCQGANDQGDLFGGTFALDFGAGAANYTLNGFVARYASLTQLNGGSGEGVPVNNPPPPPPPVPEPATWAMMLLGFGATGLALRRRREKEGLTQIA